MEQKDLKLLVIEDEPYVLESYVDMLEAIGYNAATADNGKEGLLKLSREDFDIVITDLNMPVMDGQETLKRIKSKYPHVEVIVVTGYATIENAISAMKLGAFDYITKPVSLEHVKIVLNRCLQHISAAHENEELKSLNQQLKHVNELKDKFITITNHELRTPLAVLKGYTELLEISIDDKGEDIQEYLNIVSSTISEMIDLVERMHNLSRAGKSFTPVENIVFNLNDAVKTVSDEMKILFGNRGINFETFSSHKEILVKADMKSIHRVLRELLQNALKFTNVGGEVKLNLKKENTNNKIYVSVEDTGIGIPSDKIKYVFEPFYEVQDVMHHSSSQVDFMGGGIGVGLSLVKEILQSFDGEVDVQSKEGSGSTFTIVLPLVTQDIPELIEEFR